MRRGRRFLGGLVLLLAVVGSSFPSGAGVAQEADQAWPSRFGVVEAYYRPDDAQALGVGWERIVFEWPRFQPDGPDQFLREAVPAAHLREAREAGREVVGLLKNVPNWASGAEKTIMGAVPHGLDLPLDDPRNVWAAFVRQTVRVYSQEWGIHHWIIFNEPDIRPGEMPWYEFDGDVVDYYRMLKVAYLAAKPVDPEAVIHLAGMAWWVDVVNGRPLYLRRLLDVIAQDPDAYRHDFYFDVVSLHVYFDTENVWRMVNRARGLLAHYRQEHKPIWIDEVNARPAHDPGARVPPAPYAVSLDQQADFIVQAAALALAARVERFAVYRLYDDHYQPGDTEPWGLVRADGSRRPAFDAYQTVIRWFGDVTRAQRYASDRSMLVTLQNPHRTVYVMWARDVDDVRFFVLARQGAEQADVIAANGEQTAVEPGPVMGVDGWWYQLDAPGAVPDPQHGVMIGGSPVILVAEGPPRPVWIRVGRAEWRLR